ncbi:MAG: hypothetical protein IT287_01580 [Bdellovibrionaceae bacterium]|nr:hypothetical protein [Pseudobdellovibrionaceae bacterium]
MKGKSEFDFPQRKNLFLSEVFKDLGLAIPLESLSDFFNHYRIKNLPQAVPRILFLLSKTQATLRVVESFITPLEMLERQAQGQRILTLSRQSFLKGVKVDTKRDALEFLLHDMGHANLFFSETHEEQKEFFNTLLKDLQENKTLQDPQLDTSFKISLEYIMSDMNSSLPHLQQSLKAALIARARKENHLPKDAQLTSQQENDIRHQWNSLKELSSYNSTSPEL